MLMMKPATKNNRKIEARLFLSEKFMKLLELCRKSVMSLKFFSLKNTGTVMVSRTLQIKKAMQCPTEPVRHTA